MNALATAKKYFELSNKRDFKGIAGLIADSTSYTSPALGTLTSRADIIDKQKEFYKNFKVLNWHDKSYEKVNQNTIVIDYECEAVTKDDEMMSWSGLEYITVKDGKITKIEIKIKAS